MIFTDNWFREGIWNLRFGMYEEPKSPELSTQISRDPYISYPPGSVLPVFALSLVSGHEPSASMVMGYDLLNHLLVTVVLALTVFFFLISLKLRPVYAAAFALIPIALEQLLPAPFYFFQNSFFSDQAVILPFALVILLEVLRADATGRRRRVIDLSQGLVFFYGAFTDWLFAFVFAVFLVKRLASGEIGFRRGKRFRRGDFSFAAGFGAGIALFVIHLTVMMWGNLGWAYAYLDHKYFVRSGTGSSDGFSGFMSYFRAIRKNVWQGYGRTGELLVMFSILFVVALAVYLFVAPRRLGVSGEVRRITQLTFIVVTPCILQMYVFLDHSAVHNFSALKLSLPITIVPFVCFPVFLAVLARDLWPRLTLPRTLPFVTLAALVLAVSYAALEHGNYTRFFAGRDAEWYRFAAVTGRHSNASDVVFSPDMEIPYHPPQPVALSMKRVYRISSVAQIQDRITSATGKYQVEVIFLHPPLPGSYWARVAAAADSSLRDSDGTCYIFFSAARMRRLRL